MRFKPGPGWKFVGSSCWDHPSGVRLHVDGLCRLPTGEIINGRSWPESMSLRDCLRLVGGSQRRGAMVWALNLVKRLRSTHVEVADEG